MREQGQAPQHTSKAWSGAAKYPECRVNKETTQSQLQPPNFKACLSEWHRVGVGWWSDRRHMGTLMEGSRPDGGTGARTLFKIRLWLALYVIVL